MATTAAETSSSSGTKPESSNQKSASGQDGDRRRRTRAGDERPQTRLDSHVDAPSVTQPGDGPFDTTDPSERAVSVSPDKAAAALAGHQTVNAVVPLVEPEREEVEDREVRVEKYRTRGPDGKFVDVEHNLETGETRVS